MIQLVASFLAGLSGLFVGPFIFSLLGWQFGISWISPLVGCIALSLTGTLVFILDSDLLIIAQFALIFCGFFYFLKFLLDRNKLEESKYWIFLFGIIFLINLLVPFPGQLIAGGDWYVHLTKSTSLIDGTFGQGYAQLGRSPFYSWGSLAFIKLLGPLQGFTLYSDLVAASALICLLPPNLNAISPAQKRGLWAIFLLILVSPFFITSLQNLWPKLAAAGAMIACTRFALSRIKHSIVYSFTMLAVAIAYHESSAFYFPFVIGIMLDAGALQIRLILSLAGKPRALYLWLIKKAPEIMAMMIGFFVFVGIIRIVQISRFGVDAIVSSNPLVTFARELSLPMKIGHNILSTAFGDQFFYRLSGMIQSCASFETACKQVPYLFLAAVIPWLGGSLMGILILWAPIFLRQHLVSTLRSLRLFFNNNRYTAYGSLLVIAISLLVTQGVVHWGLVQVSLVQLALLYFYEAGRFAVKVGAIRAISFLNASMGLLPFSIFCIFGGLIVVNPRGSLSSLRQSLITGDGDLRNMLSNGWNTLFVSSDGTIIALVLPILTFLLLLCYRFIYAGKATIEPPPSILFGSAFQEP